MLAMGLLGGRLFAKISRVSDAILIPVVFALSVVGSYAIRNSMTDVVIMFVFGVIGYLIKMFDLNPASIVLALILGPIGENGLRRSLLLNNGNPAILFSTPVCWVLIFLCVFSIFSPMLMKKLENKYKE